MIVNHIKGECRKVSQKEYKRKDENLETVMNEGERKLLGFVILNKYQWKLDIVLYKNKIYLLK